MRIVVVGAGQVGSNIAANLADSHDVVVIEIDAEIVDELTYSTDILAIEGDGTSMATLRQADIEAADMLIASTDNDEMNLAICGTAKSLTDAFTVARVRNANFLETWQHNDGAFGVDFMVSADLLTAHDIVRVLGLPAAVDVDPFARGLVQMAEFEVTEESEIAGQTVAEADRFDALTFVALVCEGAVQIARGDTVIETGNRVIVIGTPESVAAFSATVADDKVATGAEDITIVGGSDIGYHTARLLQDRGHKPRLIEVNPERARELAEELPGTVVMEHDATDVSFLVSEQVDRSDVVVAATDSDERNLLISILAKNIGVPRTVAIVEEGEYADLFETVGIDVVINPREATAEEIVRFTQVGKVENLSLIEGRKAEVVEIEVEPDSALTGRPIRESVADLPAGVVIGAITRGREYVIPRGDTVIEAGDHVVIFADAESLGTLLERV